MAMMSGDEIEALEESLLMDVQALIAEHCELQQERRWS